MTRHFIIGKRKMSCPSIWARRELRAGKLFWVAILPEPGAYSHYMSTQEQERLELLQGTLDLLILRTLIFGPQHGQGIARAIQQTLADELLVEHGALYPALQRLESRRLDRGPGRISRGAKPSLQPGPTFRSPIST